MSKAKASSQSQSTAEELTRTEEIAKFLKNYGRKFTDIPVKELRHIIPIVLMEVYSDKYGTFSRKVRGLWASKPDDWQPGIPFVDPNNKLRGNEGNCKPKKEPCIQMLHYLLQRLDNKQKRVESFASLSVSITNSRSAYGDRFLPAPSPTPSESHHVLSCSDSRFSTIDMGDEEMPKYSSYFGELNSENSEIATAVKSIRDLPDDNNSIRNLDFSTDVKNDFKFIDMLQEKTELPDSGMYANQEDSEYKLYDDFSHLCLPVQENNSPLGEIGEFSGGIYIAEENSESAYERSLRASGYSEQRYEDYVNVVGSDEDEKSMMTGVYSGEDATHVGIEATEESNGDKVQGAVLGGQATNDSLMKSLNGGIVCARDRGAYVGVRRSTGCGAQQVEDCEEDGGIEITFKPLNDLAKRCEVKLKGLKHLKGETSEMYQLILNARNGLKIKMNGLATDDSADLKCSLLADGHDLEAALDLMHELSEVPDFYVKKLKKLYEDTHSVIDVNADTPMYSSRVTAECQNNVQTTASEFYAKSENTLIGAQPVLQPCSGPSLGPQDSDCSDHLNIKPRLKGGLDGCEASVFPGPALKAVQLRNVEEGNNVEQRRQEDDYEDLLKLIMTEMKPQDQSAMDELNTFKLQEAQEEQKAELDQKDRVEDALNLQDQLYQMYCESKELRSEKTGSDYTATECASGESSHSLMSSYEVNDLNSGSSDSCSLPTYSQYFGACSSSFDHSYSSCQVVSDHGSSMDKSYAQKSSYFTGLNNEYSMQNDIGMCEQNNIIDLQAQKGSVHRQVGDASQQEIYYMSGEQQYGRSSFEDVIKLRNNPSGMNLNNYVQVASPDTESIPVCDDVTSPFNQQQCAFGSYYQNLMSPMTEMSRSMENISIACDVNLTNRVSESVDVKNRSGRTGATLPIMYSLLTEQKSEPKQALFPTLDVEKLHQDTVMAKTKSGRNVPGRADKRKMTVEDYEMEDQSCVANSSAANIPLCVLEYRTDDNSFNHNKKKKSRANRK